MKARFILIALLTIGFMPVVNAQEQSKCDLEINTYLSESRGDYAQRQLCRESIKRYMKECPFISNFNIHESAGSANNHDVIWTYEVESWNNIPEFYNWITKTLKSREGDALKKALSFYSIRYSTDSLKQRKHQEQAKAYSWGMK